MSNFTKSQLTKNLALLFLLVFVASSCQSLQNARFSPSSDSPSTLPAPTSQPPIVLGDGIRASYADVVERVSPAVVNIIARRRSEPQSTNNPLMDDPNFREFFERQIPRGGGSNQPPMVERGVGSGVIVNADGTILTNHHVVENATDIEVELTDKRSFKARIVGSDQPSDLAVLKVEANNLPFLNLGDSDRTRVGDVVLALGNPLGIGQTVTLGIISAKGRRTGIGDGSFEDFLQTDAPINRGNSGGALVNLTGELIGINSQILSTSGGSIGIGFAIPSNMARGVIDQLVKNGKVRRGLLGVNIQEITSDNAAALNLKESRGAIVSSVQPASAAEKAGLKRYDVITALNGEAIEDGNSFRNRIASMQPGTVVTITINRDGRQQEIKATLDERSAETAQNNSRQNPLRDNGEQSEENVQSGKLGLGLQPLTPELGRQLQIQADKGLVVTEVDAAGPAAEAGIAKGDVILEINRQPVGSFDEVQSALEKSGGRPVLLLITRRGQTIFLTVQPR